MYHEKSTILSYFEFVCVDSVSTKVGFNLMGRQPCQVTAIGFMPWALQQVQKDTKVIDRDKNITMTVEAEKGGLLTCVWWKDGVQRNDRSETLLCRLQ